MPNQIALEQVELVELTQSVDDGRVAADPFKLLAALRTLLDSRLADLEDEGCGHAADRRGSRHRVGAGPSGSRSTPHAVAGRFQFHSGLGELRD